MNTREKLRKEEEALEARLFSTPSKDTAKSTEAATDPNHETKSAEAKAQASAEVKPEVKTEDVRTREEDWKKRYTNLRASRDEKLYAAQQELAETKELVLTLQQKVQELEAATVTTKDIFEGIITDEDKEAIGDTALEAMRKTASAAAEENRKAIEKELAEIREMKKKAAEEEVKRTRQSAYDNFLQRLASAVPDYASIDVDPKFAEYMSELDIDGNSKADNFRRAESRGDVAAVARYMLDYKASIKEPKKNPLEDKITPEAKATSTPKSTESKDDVLTWKQVNEHYEKFAKGWYRGRKAEYEAMEKRIDEAAAKGLIRR